MTAAAIQTPRFQIDLDHWEQLSRTFSAVTIDPYKNTLFYFFPFASAFFSSHVQMRENDPAQEAMMPSAAKSLILKEIGDLTQAAGIRRSIAVYSALNHSFSNAGGSLSATSPALFLPHQHLFRPGRNPFGQETAQDQLASDLWSFTDDETRFLVARELAHIHKNDALLRIAMKTALLASLFILYATPIGWFAGCLVMAASAVLHLLSERSFQAKMDLAAIEIVSKRLGDRPRAIKAALSVLEKLQNQNLARREHSALCRLYLSKSGNNFLDFCRPYITSRIDRIRKSSLPV